MITAKMKRIDLLHILDALESAEAEFEQLMLDEEWFVTEVVDKLVSAKQIVEEKLDETLYK